MSAGAAVEVPAPGAEPKKSSPESAAVAAILPTLTSQKDILSAKFKQFKTDITANAETLKEPARGVKLTSYEDLMSSHSALSSVIIHEGMDDIEETISDLIEQGRLQSEALQAAADALAEREKKWVEKRSHTMMVSTQNIKKVKFDVGGRIFSISLDALLACKGLMFESLFSEGWGPQAGYDGTIFIDRDPAAYEFIFNYLRAQATGTKLPIPQDSLAREALKKEADFLCLADLTEALKTPPPSKTPPRSNKPPSLPLGAKRTACCPQCHHPNDYFYGIGTWNPHLNYYICNQCDLKFNVIQHQIAERVLT